MIDLYKIKEECGKRHIPSDDRCLKRLDWWKNCKDCRFYESERAGEEVIHECAVMRAFMSNYSPISWYLGNLEIEDTYGN